jgi:hypothetical protein
MKDITAGTTWRILAPRKSITVVNASREMPALSEVSASCTNHCPTRNREYFQRVPRKHTLNPYHNILLFQIVHNPPQKLAFPYRRQQTFQIPATQLHHMCHTLPTAAQITYTHVVPIRSTKIGLPSRSYPWKPHPKYRFTISFSLYDSRMVSAPTSALQRMMLRYMASAASKSCLRARRTRRRLGSDRHRGLAVGSTSATRALRSVMSLSS